MKLAGGGATKIDMAVGLLLKAPHKFWRTCGERINRLAAARATVKTSWQSEMRNSWPVTKRAFPFSEKLKREATCGPVLCQEHSPKSLRRMVSGTRADGAPKG